MRILLLLALASPLWASQSLVTTTALRANATISNGAAGWATLASYCIEFGFQPTGSAGLTFIQRLENDLGLGWDGTNVFTLVRGGGSGPSVPIAINTFIRGRFCRVTASSEYRLEVWNEATGLKSSSIIVDSNPTSYDCSNRRIGIIAEAAPVGNVYFVRTYSGSSRWGSGIPDRLIASGYGDLANYELEGNLLDQSGRGLNWSVTAGSTAYVTTTVLPPVVSIAAPTTVRTGTAASLVSTCISNEDTPSCSLFWNQTASASGTVGAFSSRTSATLATFTPSVFGQYDLSVTATTGTQSSATAYALGAVATDANGAVLIDNPDIAAIIGPIIRGGANPWSWYDNRAAAAALLQINQQTGVGGATLPYWSRPWDTNLGGTITVVNGNATINGIGTQFQTDFCGGPGNTSPISAFNQIYIKYNNPDYSGSLTLARYNVISCTSQTSLTVNQVWGHAAGTQAGLSYARSDAAVAGWWTNTNTPGNYYDNVLALYVLYYQTGLTRYRDAARTLARNFWEGPFYGRGKNYDLASVGGTFIAAGPARGQSIAGLFLWAIESGENIWPGMAYVLSAQKAFGYDYALARSWNVQIGDLREQGYLTAAYALAARFHPDSATRTLYRNVLKDYVNLFWEPLQLPTGEWRNTLVSNAGYYGTPFVTVTNGSDAITLNGSTWSAGTFCNGNFTPCDYRARIWFFNNRTNPDIPGKTNADLGGDAVDYRVINVTSSTTATLDRAYQGTSGNKGAIVGSLSGFGTQPFMMALTAGVFGTYAYDAMIFHGDTAEANKLRQFTIDAGTWLSSAVAYDPVGHFNYGASTFINCVADPTSPGCAGDTVLNGEGTRGISASYGFTGSTATLAYGDDLYTALWCKPSGGWACGTAGYGMYANYLDDFPSGYMMNPSDPLINKWFGFFFGYGFGASWPVARVGGIRPLDTRTVRLAYTAPAGTSATTITCTAPNGVTAAAISCSAGNCSIPQDWRQGNYLCRLAHTVTGGTMAGDLTELRLQ